MESAWPVLRKGIHAYYDTFAGSIPCKVLSVTCNFPDNETRATSSVRVLFQLTATVGAYKKGEYLESNALHVFPQQCRHQRMGHAAIVDYVVELD